MNWLQKKARFANAIVPGLKNRLNHGLREVLKPTYFDSIPLSDIDKVCRDNGCLLVQEDGTPWSGLFTGRKGTAKIDVASLEKKQPTNYEAYIPFDNTALILMWEKMESGRYEIVGYFS